MEVYGMDAGGMLSRCKAKPENRGRGRCNHEEHYSMSKELMLDTNKKTLEARALREAGVSKSTFLVGVKKNTMDRIVVGGGNYIKPSEDSYALDRVKFNKASIKLSHELPEFTKENMENFYAKISPMLIEDGVQPWEVRPAVLKRAVDGVYTYLKSDDEDASRVRDFLGEGVDVRDFSHLLVEQVHSMCEAKGWRNNGRSNPINRVILSSVKNDMNRERYVASVLYFGGRCCYCNVNLCKDGGKATKATGEHITPLNTGINGAVGEVAGTRFGNMALACDSCNQDRKNKKLEEWVASTNKISRSNRPLVLERIKNFREFALYREYSEEDMEKIRVQIKELEDYIDNFEKVDKKYTESDAVKIKEKVILTIQSLNGSIH